MEPCTTAPSESRPPLLGGWQCPKQPEARRTRPLPHSPDRIPLAPAPGYAAAESGADYRQSTRPALGETAISVRPPRVAGPLPVKPGAGSRPHRLDSLEATRPRGRTHVTRISSEAQLDHTEAPPHRAADDQQTYSGLLPGGRVLARTAE